MTKTPIEWTDFSVNPFRFRNLETGKVGHHCTKISPGCKNCYASKLQGGPYLSGLIYIEENKAKGEFFLDDAVLEKVLRRKKPARIFWCDMTDMFLEDYPDEWIDRCFAVMALTPQHTHQVLTKREKRMREYFSVGARPWVARVAAEALLIADNSSDRNLPERCRVKLPLPNVHLGVSAEDQPRADERIVELLATPAAVRWVSMEPALGPVDFGFNRWVRLPRAVISELPFAPAPYAEKGIYRATANPLGALAVPAAHTGKPLGVKPGEFERLPNLDWVVCGGESGRDARPCDLAWLRSAVAQCKAAGVPVFVKQLGAAPHSIADRISHRGDPLPRGDGFWRFLNDPKGGDPEEWPADLRVREVVSR